ncbi:exocyst complex component Sec3 [Plectosphaerella plurivora]|uniref:Exocyst complex component Sec3 n=1 Tax=Plectosphaerella plurivora TaxID=936078 RepID=A0A9P9A8X7_9PEZI|nr:exocyst complex component Sec3 [Plectosphaerella plurivora]
MDRAARFEDEKRRIVESLFTKKDVDGSLLETYITHIRITEYSSFPTSPPPPQARTPEARKPRVIIVAVRKSGRVRMHKSKENPNGTFSIGKTWNLDDLTAIGSFTGPPTSATNKEWAGDTGFTVTLGKPYFWDSQSDKEKKFFIASLIKIYGKYTGGRSPELTGFDLGELEQVTSNRRPPPQRSPVPEMPSYLPRNNNDNASMSSNMSSNMPSNIPSNMPSNMPMRPREVIPVPGPGAFPPSRLNTPDSIAQTPPEPPMQQAERPPERRRPPMDPLRPQGATDQDLVPAPLMSPGVRREPVAPPPRSMDRMSPRKLSGSFKDRPITPGSFKDRPVTPGSFKDRPITPGSLKDRPITPLMEPALPSSDATPAIPSPAAPSPAAPSPAAPSPVIPSPAAAPSPAPVEDAEGARPGLGPMIKKSRGEIAGAFWKAASAANAASAFKPRPGGAGDRLRQAAQQVKSEDGSDGITGVFQPPPKPKVEEPEATPEETPAVPAVPPVPPVSAARTPEVPSVRITVPNSSRPSSLQAPAKTTDAPKLEEKKSSESIQEEARKSAVSGNDAKYVAALGIDPSILDQRSTEFGKWLDHFGFVPGEKMRKLDKAQAGGWLARFRENDDRCDELDNLLTLYGVELGTLSEDIAYIEAQGQGLQVQTSNQKLLKRELESLLETISINSNDLGALERAPLETTDGIKEIEAALVMLSQSMVKMDPNLGTESSKEPGSATEESDQTSEAINADYSRMRVVQEKRQLCVQTSALFMRRLVEYMARQFIQAHSETTRQMNEALSRKVDSRHHDAARDKLWMYSPLMLYAKDFDVKNWDRLLQLYQDQSQSVYNKEFLHIITAYKKNARKMGSDEAVDILFTSYAEKKEEGTLTTARKLTVKRSQTLAKSLRNPLDSSSKSNLRASESQSLPFETFGTILDDIMPLVEMEQNFIVDFFHATAINQTDFAEASAIHPRDRMGGDLRRHRMMEPDRELARRVTKAMEVIFGFVDHELTKLVEWVLMSDSLQGVGVLAALERHMADISQTNQDFLNTVMQKLHGYLEGRFKKFVDDQIRAIEETKVKINKRKGVISFIRIFPNFSSAVENILAGVDSRLEVRSMVDREYSRILKSMFDSLKIIARENPAVAVNAGSSVDPEDKEALNFHILLIENANHYLEEVDTRGLEVLEEWNANAQAELDEHMRLYIEAVVRRPLGRLLEYLENIEAQLASGKLGSSIAAQPSNSRGIFNKTLGAYDAKEVRKGIETLRKRVEKHFSDEDPSLSKTLVAKVLQECERFYGDIELRVGRITADVYGGDVLFEWPRQEVKSGFSTR